MDTLIQPKIIGYRQLNEVEAELMNRIKDVANTVGALVNAVKAAEGVDIDQRWASIGQTELQQGFMALVRSVARPTTF